MLERNRRIHRARSPLLIGFEAARVNLVPGLLVQAAMLAVVLLFYFAPSAQGVFAMLATAKEDGGYWFSLGAGVIAGAVLPELLTVAIFQRGPVTRANFGNVKFAAIYWGLDGVLVDAFYRLQTRLFGNTPDFATVATKVLVDQFIFNPFLVAPLGLALYAWKHQGYEFAGMSRALTWRFHREQTVPALVATWGVWIPVTAAIYALPSPLQVPLFALALTFWVLLFTYITRVKNAGPPSAPAPAAAMVD